MGTSIKLLSKVVKNRQVTEKKITVKGKIAYWIKWGEFEKERDNGTTYKIMRFRNGYR